MTLNADNWEVIGLSSPKLVVMPSNNSGIQIGRLCGMYPGRIGWLIGPGGWRQPPSWMPVALDNGAYGAWEKQIPWDENAWWKLLEEAMRCCLPIWAVVPDVVTDREATIASWHKWEPILRDEFPGLPLAMAVQDGMTPEDVPAGVHTVFVGGSPQWKWRSLPMWTKTFPRVHVGKVNSKKKLWQCTEHGAVSCDGTGWTQGGEQRLQELADYLEMSTGRKNHPQMVMEALL